MPSAHTSSPRASDLDARTGRAWSLRSVLAVLAITACALLLAAWADRPGDPADPPGDGSGAAVSDPPAADPERQPPPLLRLFLDDLAQTPPVLAELDRNARAELSRALNDFYRARDDRVAWIHGKELRPRTQRLLAQLRAAADHGLEPADYDPRKLELRAKVLAGRTGPVLREQFQLELDLAAAFLLYVSDLTRGRFDPARHPRLEWYATRAEVDLPATLERIARGEPDDLDALAPARPEYRSLLVALARYRDLAGQGGWRELPGADLPGTGSEDELAVRWLHALAERLQAEGDLAVADAERLTEEWTRSAAATAPYPPELEEAVRVFQRRHGLDDDGRVGEGTRAALDVSVGDRIEQIALNLERLRWLPDAAERRILVRVPLYELTAFDGGEPTQSMRVVTGKPSWRTPSFVGRMSYLVLNPAWNVPGGIAGNEMVPALRRNPSYLDQENLELVDRESGRVVDPSSLDLGRLDLERYRFRQSAGPANALGRIKFIFPNRFDVYLHDTPSRADFERAERAISHGCIRVGEPLRLADYVIDGHPEWDRSSLRSRIDSGRHHQVDLEEQIPVEILYLTVGADGPEGPVRFARDVYGHDRELRGILGSLPRSGGRMANAAADAAHASAGR